MWLIALVLTYLVLESRAQGIRSKQKQEAKIKETQEESATPTSGNAREFNNV